MAKATKSKSKSQQRREAEGVVDARPQHEGKDPLAGGERLHNVSNSSDAKTYEADHNPVDAPRPRAQVAGQPGQPVTQSLPAHKVKNSSQEEQEEVAKGRTE